MFDASTFVPIQIQIKHEPISIAGLNAPYLLQHRQSKEWTGNASKCANVADATFVINGLIRLTLEPYNSTSKTFQHFVFIYFDQERQCQCTYQFLKLVWDITKLKTDS